MILLSLIVWNAKDLVALGLLGALLVVIIILVIAQIVMNLYARLRRWLRRVFRDG